MNIPHECMMKNKTFCRKWNPRSLQFNICESSIQRIHLRRTDGRYIWRFGWRWSAREWCWVINVWCVWCVCSIFNHCHPFHLNRAVVTGSLYTNEQNKNVNEKKCSILLQTLFLSQRKINTLAFLLFPRSNFCSLPIPLMDFPSVFHSICSALSDDFDFAFIFSICCDLLRFVSIWGAEAGVLKPGCWSRFVWFVSSEYLSLFDILCEWLAVCQLCAMVFERRIVLACSSVVGW